jgi:hypothetical protein
LLFEVLVTETLDGLGVAGNFLLSFWLLPPSPPLLVTDPPDWGFEIEAGFRGGGVGAGVEADDEFTDDC